MNNMKTFVHDNPATMRRECWQNGRIVCSYSWQVLPPFAKTSIPSSLFFFGANIGKFIPGQRITFGDCDA